MKSLALAAAALLLGTSAFAFAPSTEPAAAPAVAKDPLAVSPAAAAPVAAPFAGTSEEAPVVQPASAVTWESADAGDPDLDLAVDPDAEAASLTGMGGPEEPLDVAATAAPATAAAYRPCRPGPGDDNCIQLYEPGVREALASWTPRAAGEATAMGGPYEPVEGAGADMAMAGDGAVDRDMGETPADEVVGI